MICSWLNLLFQNLGYGGPAIKLYDMLQLQEGLVPVIHAFFKGQLCLLKPLLPNTITLSMNFEETQIFCLLPEVRRKGSWDLPVYMHPLPPGSLGQDLQLCGSQTGVSFGIMGKIH